MYFLRLIVRSGVSLIFFSFALARLGGKMPHQVLVGVAEQVIALGPVGAEVETVEYGNQLGEAVLHLLAGAELALVVEVGLVDNALEFVGLGEPADDLVDLVADLLVAFEIYHVGETATGRHFNERVRIASVLVGDVLHKQQRQDVVLVLRSIHAAAQLVAALPDRGIELGFLQGHSSVSTSRRREPAGAQKPDTSFPDGGFSSQRVFPVLSHSYSGLFSASLPSPCSLGASPNHSHHWSSPTRPLPRA